MWRATFGGRAAAMVFSNLTFVCLFLPITLALYFNSPKWLHNAVLVLASIVFYIWGGRVAIFLVLISIAVNFCLGQAIASAGVNPASRVTFPPTCGGAGEGPLVVSPPASPAPRPARRVRAR